MIIRLVIIQIPLLRRSYRKRVISAVLARYDVSCVRETKRCFCPRTEQISARNGGDASLNWGGEGSEGATRDNPRHVFYICV